MHQQSKQRSSGTTKPCYNLPIRRSNLWWKRILRKAIHFVNVFHRRCARYILTAKDPGAFLAAVHCHPLYRPKPSSFTILTTPRPRNASGFVCLLIFKTSRGRRTISPIPITLNQEREPVPFRWEINRNIPSGKRGHHRLSSLLSKCWSKCRDMVLLEVIPNEGLSTILVNPLQNLPSSEQAHSIVAQILAHLVSSCISKSWEKREELLASLCVCGVSEDNFV